VYFNFKLTQSQNELQTVWTDDISLLQGVKFIRRAVSQSATHHVVPLILQTPPLSEWRTGQPYGDVEFASRKPVRQHWCTRCFTLLYCSLWRSRRYGSGV